MIEHAGGVDDDRGLGAIAAYGLPGSVIQLQSGPDNDDEWIRLVDTCRAHGLLGILSAAGWAGDIELSESQMEELAAFDKELEDLVALVEAEAARESELLSKRGVNHRLLGGVSLRFHYRTPELRNHALDTMLLVQAEAAGAASASGEKASADLRTPPAPSQPSVPLHATMRIAGHSLGLANLVDPPVMLELAGRAVPTVSLEEHLVLACMRFDPEASSPVTQRDIAELALSPDGASAEYVQSVAEAWDVTSLVTRALAEVWRRFELADKTELSVWAARGATRPRGAYGARTGRPGQVLRRRGRDAMQRLIKGRGSPTATPRTSS